MVGVRISVVCDQLRAPTPAGRLVGVGCEWCLGLPGLHGHALQSGTWQVRVRRCRHDFGDADQPELARFPGDSDSLLLAAPSLVWSLGFVESRLEVQSRKALGADCFQGEWRAWP